MKIAVAHYLVNQETIIAKLERFLNARGLSSETRKKIMKGMCLGFSLLYGYDQLQGNDFFRRIQEIDRCQFRSSLSDVSYGQLLIDERKLEHFCNDILCLNDAGFYGLFLGRQLNFVDAIHILSGQHEKVFFSNLHYVSVFHRDPLSGNYDSLIHRLLQIVNTEPQESKYLQMCCGDHAIGIFYRDHQCFLYDPNNLFAPIPVDSRNIDAMTHMVDQLAQRLVSFHQSGFNPSIALGIDVIMKRSSQEMKALSHQLLRDVYEELSDLNNASVFSISVEMGFSDVIQKLVSHYSGPYINRSFLGCPLLLRACMQGNADVVKTLLECPGIDPHLIPDEFYSKIPVADLEQINTEVVKEFDAETVRIFQESQFCMISRDELMDAFERFGLWNDPEEDDERSKYERLIVAEMKAFFNLNRRSFQLSKKEIFDAGMKTMTVKGIHPLLFGSHFSGISKENAQAWHVKRVVDILFRMCNEPVDLI